MNLECRDKCKNDEYAEESRKRSAPVQVRLCPSQRNVGKRGEVKCATHSVQR